MNLDSLINFQSLYNVHNSNGNSHLGGAGERQKKKEEKVWGGCGGTDTEFTVSILKK